MIKKNKKIISMALIAILAIGVILSGPTTAQAMSKSELTNEEMTKLLHDMEDVSASFEEAKEKAKDVAKEHEQSTNIKKEIKEQKIAKSLKEAVKAVKEKSDKTTHNEKIDDARVNTDLVKVNEGFNKALTEVKEYEKNKALEESKDIKTIKKELIKIANDLGMVTDSKDFQKLTENVINN